MCVYTHGSYKEDTSDIIPIFREAQRRSLSEITKEEIETQRGEQGRGLRCVLSALPTVTLASPHPVPAHPAPSYLPIELATPRYQPGP